MGYMIQKVIIKTIVAAQTKFEFKYCHLEWKSEWFLPFCVLNLFVGLEFFPFTSTG